MLHSDPNSDEILEAVREFLRHDVVQHTSGTTAFHARVAARLIETLERQQATAPARDAEFQTELSRWSVAEESALAGLIRSGRLRHDDPELLDFLDQTTRWRLAVWNPEYVDHPGDDDPRVDPPGKE